MTRGYLLCPFHLNLLNTSPLPWPSQWEERKTDLNIQASLPLQPHCILTKGLLKIDNIGSIRASPCTNGWELAQYLGKPRNLRLQSCCWADTPGENCQELLKLIDNSDFTRSFKFTPLVAFFIKVLAPLPAHSCSSLLDVSRQSSSSYKPCFLKNRYFSIGWVPPGALKSI